MNLTQALALLGMLTDTVQAKQQQIDVLTAEIERLRREAEGEK